MHLLLREERGEHAEVCDGSRNEAGAHAVAQQVNTLRVGVLRDMHDQAAQVTRRIHRAVEIGQVSPHAEFRRPGVGDECAPVAEKVPELGGHEHRVFEIHLVAVHVDVDVFGIRTGEPTVDFFGEYIAGFRTALGRTVEGANRAFEDPELLHFGDVERVVLRPVLQKRDSACFFPGSLLADPESDRCLAEP